MWLPSLGPSLRLSKINKSHPYDLACGQLKLCKSVPDRFVLLKPLGTKQKSPANARLVCLVPRGGIEPPTRGFSIPCSTD